MGNTQPSSRISTSRAAERGSARAPAGRRGRAGFTLLELAIAISILLIGLVALVSASSRMDGLRKQNRERTILQNGVRSMAERIHARAQEFSTDPATWAARLLAVFGPGGTSGDTFDIEGLSPAPGSAAVGRIRIVTDETASDVVLGAELGMPRDLNGDGDDDDVDVSASARLLPVILSLRWKGQSGDCTYTHAFFVLGY